MQILRNKIFSFNIMKWNRFPKNVHFRFFNSVIWFVGNSQTQNYLLIALVSVICWALSCFPRWLCFQQFWVQLNAI